jgi:hypothetical protein
MNNKQNYITTAVKGILIIGWASAMFSGAAQADIFSGDINTSLSASNISTDGISYANAPSGASFATLTVGEFDFSLPSGASIGSGSLSGNFGSNNLSSATAQVALFADGIAVATCDVNCAAASQSNDVAWTYTFTATDLAMLNSNAQWQAGQLVLTAQQLTPYQIALDPTTVSLTSVPLPGAVWLFLSALVTGLGFSRRKAV